MDVSLDKCIVELFLLIVFMLEQADTANQKYPTDPHKQESKYDICRVASINVIHDSLKLVFPDQRNHNQDEKTE